MAHPLSVITTASTSSQMDSFAHRSHGLKATHAALKVMAKWSVYLFWSHDESWLKCLTVTLKICWNFSLAGEQWRLPEAT
jgi:hypothetical protein